MPGCEFVQIKTISDVQVELCAMTGRICPVDPRVGNYQECVRRAWQLDQERKHQANSSENHSPYT